MTEKQKNWIPTVIPILMFLAGIAGVYITLQTQVIRLEERYEAMSLRLAEAGAKVVVLEVKEGVAAEIIAALSTDVLWIRMTQLEVKDSVAAIQVLLHEIYGKRE